MVQIIDQSGSIAGRIGKGFGKGLSEQLPKEVERLRLSQGLRNLEEQGGQMTPFQQAANLSSIPGITPQMMSVLQPLLQQQNALREAQGSSQQSGFSPQTQSAQAVGSITSPTGDQTTQGQAPGPIPQHQEFRRLGDPDSLRQRAAQLTQERPYQYPTLDSGLAQAQKEYDTQQGQMLNIAAGFEGALSKKLQKGGTDTFSDVLGDLQEKFRVKAEEDVLKGKLSEQEAINHYTKQALDFAKSRQNLKAVGGWSVFPSTAKADRRAIDSIRDQYKKLDQMEEFKNDLISYQGLSELGASQVAFPVESNKEIGSYLDKVKEKPISFVPLTRSEKGGPLGIGIAKSPSEIAEKIAPMLKSDDSLSSIAANLERKGYDYNEFLNEIRNKYQNGDVRLNERQARELESVTTRRSLGDWYLFSLAGMNP